jgi:membrane protease YdiL (CAAX protease family)
MAPSGDAARKASGGRLAAAAQLVVMAALTAVVIPAITPSAAVAGGVAIKVLFLGRMALLVLIATLFLRLRGLGWRDLGLRSVSPERLILAALLGLAATLLLVAAAKMVLHAWGVTAIPDYSMFAPLRGDLKLYLYLLIPVTWGTAAIGEEMLFRGFFLDAIRRLLAVEGWPATLCAVVVQAALFAALHLYQGPAGAATAGAVGLAFGLAWRIAGRNLWPGILLHGLFDSVAMTAIYLSPMPHR